MTEPTEESRAARAKEPEGDGPPPDPPPREQDPMLRIDEVVRGFTEDSSLYPVLAVVVVIFATLAGAAVVLALQRNIAAMGAVAGLAVLTFGLTESDRRRRRPGPTSLLLLVFWALAIGGALIVQRSTP